VFRNVTRSIGFEYRKNGVLAHRPRTAPDIALSADARLNLIPQLARIDPAFYQGPLPIEPGEYMFINEGTVITCYISPADFIVLVG